ncbi:MAG: SDR family oxidoreductase [Actinobacteria bacterium]|nr:SDR family oxidoreductase [Actinomycetota bacterium]
MTGPTALPLGFRLDERVAIVTGFASGIGKATAQLLAEAGATVVGADLTSNPSIDVSKREQVEALVAETVAAHTRIDVMVNVAGIMRTAELVDLAEDDLDAVLAVNLKGVLFGTQAAIRAMRDQGTGGSIVNVTSAAIDMPAAGYGAYAISKAGVAMLTRTAAVEAGKHGIRVNAVAPGFVETAMTGRWFTSDDGVVDDTTRESFLAAVAKQSPLGMSGEPEDIAAAILYLASDASRFMTGQILRPNGGTVMPW